MLNGDIDGSSSLDAVYDGLHGYIALDDVWGRKTGKIRNLLGAPYLQRLRHVKQLGFVSQSFLSAEHNRYAHALGTMHMMRSLLSRLQRRETNPDNFWKKILLDAAKQFEFFERIAPYQKKRDALFQHLLVAALLQDVGEYPYAKATEFFFRPDESVKTFLRRKFSFDVENMENKSLMTLATVFDDTMTAYVEELNPQFLAFLLCGELPIGVECSPGMTVLRHMLDGAIDADRLDYVFRDTYHALGERGIAAPIVDSLLTYDDGGPVLKHVRPVTDFLSKRALLWSSVYHAPENRFRVILLRTIFREYSSRLDLSQKAFGENPFSSDQAGFRDLDDRFIERLIATLNGRKPDDVSPNVSKAVKFLSASSSDYEYIWVPIDADKEADLSGSDILPNFFFSDRYSDYLSHSLYEVNSVRVRGSRYKTGDKKRADGTVALENCVGPFSAALKAPWPSLPMPGHMAWFQPINPGERADGRWRRLEELRKGGDDPVLRGHLITNDVMLDGDIGFDTREEPNTKAPDIFISFRWTDYRMVYRIASVLKKQHRRYYNLGGDFIGFGATIAANSRDAVNQADAVILLYSEDYAKRYFEKLADGAISAEVNEMIVRKRTGLPIVVLSMEPHEKLTDKLPWGGLGYEGGLPAVGKPLRSASDEELRKSVDDALRRIEAEMTRRKAATPKGRTTRRK